jgi:hypothetical protein
MPYHYLLCRQAASSKLLGQSRDCKNDKPEVASLRSTQVHGAYHVAAWLDQRRAGDTQVPSIGNASRRRKATVGAASSRIRFGVVTVSLGD